MTFADADSTNVAAAGTAGLVVAGIVALLVVWLFARRR